MGSKKYKGKPCAYCADGVSDDGEHVVSRKFFPVEFRANLPKAPSCGRCNGEKAKLEHYLTAVMPIPSGHVTGLGSQVREITRRLNANKRLKDELRSGIAPALFRSADGTVEVTDSIPFDPEKLREYYTYVVKGLTWYEWETVVPEDHAIGVMLLTSHNYEIFCDHFLNVSAEFRADKSFAEGGLSYVGRKSSDGVGCNAWNIRLYEGFHVPGTTTDGETSEPVEVCALTGPPNMRKKIEELVREFQS